MYLKSIVLKGFKSFADRTVINFAPGISAIVGPNGSGKSNISEAVLWVLGERKTSNLRVHSMEELIFSGSSARPAAKVAEVDLVLDNSDGTIPIEFSEVVITRRMHHNGESEYLLNGSPCLRRDVIDILHDSAIGEGVHSVITQGNLTAMIESRPEDRMRLMEDAAGVLKHKSRKERAQRQLEKMDSTLKRVNDIVKVIDSQLRPLERQASRAKRYKEYSDELKQLSLALAVDDLRNLQSSWEEMSKNEKEIEAEVELVGFRLEEKEEEVAKRQAALEQKGLFVGDLNEQRNRCQSIMARLDSNMRLLEEKGKNMVSQLSTLRGTIHTSETRLQSAQDERKQTAGESEADEAKLKGLYSTFNELNRKSEQITKSRREAQEAYDALSSKLRNNESALAKTKDNLARAESSLESLDVEEGLLKERLEQIQSDISSAQSQLSEQRDKFDGISGDMLKAQGELALARSDIDKRVRLLDQAKAEMGEQRDKLADIQAEIKALKEIERAYQSASPSMSWITEHQSEFAGIVGRISQVISAPSELEPLVERLLGADINGLLVVDIKSANMIAERLVKSGSDNGEVSFLPINENLVEDLPTCDDGQRLIDLVKYDESYDSVVKSLIGDVYVADSISQAVLFHTRNDAPVRFATRDGAVVWPSGKITLGSQIADMEGVLSRQRKLNELTAENETCTANLGDAEMAVSEAEKNLQLAQQDGFELSESLAKLQGSYDSAEAEVKRLEQQIMQLNATREQTDLKLKSVNVRRGQSSPLAQEYRSRIETLNENISSMRDDVEASSQELLRITQEKSDIVQQVYSVKTDMETCRQSIEFKRRRLEKLDAEIKDLEKTLKVSRETEISLSVIRLRVDPLYKVFEELHSGISEWARKLQEQAKLTQSDSKSLRDIIDEAKKARDEAKEQQTQAMAKLNEAKVERAKLEADVKYAIQRIEQDNGTSIEAALEVPPVEDRAQAEDTVARLKRKIEGLGAVNHVAMEEYENLKAKRDHITEQVADLVDARKKLNTITRALETKMKKQFNATFDDVNERFKSLYEQLSPGDTGELVILDKTADSEGGIEIVIHPRGMKLTSLTQLSGGQSALVAISFLFAIYLTRNAPFYILDEIEPALDGTNLQRVCDLLDSMRNETQLIMVTHQRQTMEIADVLYGVSKQASGVSKVVSQKLDQAIRSLEEEEAAEKEGE
ncbi:MAG: chromosome segregation protein SMC [Coriobacteriales bacterium]